MGLFSLKRFSIFTFLFAAIVFYNYVFLHKLVGLTTPAILWSMLVGTNSKPFHLSPFDHVLRRPEIRRYEMVLQNEIRWPDGVEKTVITINGKPAVFNSKVALKWDPVDPAGQFPGPTLEVRSGDTLEVTVRNNLPDEEGTSLHWHGLKMRGETTWISLLLIRGC
jgi:FtsP/CotA-like multicopper oxidase with cupredoxin domain